MDLKFEFAVFSGSEATLNKQTSKESFRWGYSWILPFWHLKKAKLKRL